MRTQPDFGDLMGLTEAAKDLGVTLPTVKAWARAGRLRYVIVAGRMVVSRRDVEKLATQSGELVQA